VVEQKNDSK